MTPFFPTPADLTHCPELALMIILQTTLEMSRRMLLAAYPDFCDDDRSEVPSAEYAYLEAIFHQLDALERTLRGYRQCLGHRPGIESGDPDDDAF